MSKNFELICRAYEAWNRDDLDAWLETLHPEIEWHTSDVYPDLDPVYRGHDGLAEFWRRLHEPWETFNIDIEQIEEEDDYFAVAVRFRAKGVDSAVEVDMRFGHGLRVRDGLLVEGFSRRTVEEARKALRKSQPAARSRQP